MRQVTHLEPPPGEASEFSTVTCCDVAATLVVGAWTLFVNLCPILAQYRALHTLCHADEYLNTQKVDKSTRFWAHVQLILNGYVVLYLVGYACWWIVAHFDDSTSNWRRHTAQTVATLGVGKLWYEMARIGTTCVYGSPWNGELLQQHHDVDTCTSVCTWLLGAILMTVCSFGLFWPVYCIQLCSKHWDNTAEPWKRECVHLAVGLVVFTLWARWFRAGLEWWNQEAPKSTSTSTRIAGALSLSVTTLGVWAVGALVHYTVFTWWTACTWSHSAIYKQAFAERSTFSCTRWLAGHVVLTLTTCGLFVPFRILESICKGIAWIPDNWNSAVPWRRETARWVGGLGVGTLWIRAFQVGCTWAYGDTDLPNEQRQVNCTKQVAGHLLLTITTVGLYLLWCLALLWVASFVKGRTWVYDESREDVSMIQVVGGHLLLLLTTVGLLATRGSMMATRPWKSN
jgi:hypothetical protein